MRGIKELGNCEIIRNIERSCSDRRHGGDERTAGDWAEIIQVVRPRCIRPHDTYSGLIDAIGSIKFLNDSLREKSQRLGI